MWAAAAAVASSGWRGDMALAGAWLGAAKIGRDAYVAAHWQAQRCQISSGCDSMIPGLLLSAVSCSMCLSRSCTRPAPGETTWLWRAHGWAT